MKSRKTSTTEGLVAVVHYRLVRFSSFWRRIWWSSPRVDGVTWSDVSTVWAAWSRLVYVELALCLNSLGLLLDGGNRRCLHVRILLSKLLCKMRFHLLKKLLKARLHVGLLVLKCSYLLSVAALEFRYGIRIFKNVLGVKKRDNNSKSRSDEKIRIAAYDADDSDRDQDKQAGNNGDDLGGLHFLAND